MRERLMKYTTTVCISGKEWIDRLDVIRDKGYSIPDILKVGIEKLEVKDKERIVIEARIKEGRNDYNL
jgi:hypothetical protein